MGDGTILKLLQIISNPLCADYFKKYRNHILHLLSFFETELLPVIGILVEEKYIFILFGPYHDCLWPCDRRIQGINSHSFKPERAVIELSRFHLVNIMPTDVLTLYITRTSAAMILTVE